MPSIASPAQAQLSNDVVIYISCHKDTMPIASLANAMYTNDIGLDFIGFICVKFLGPSNMSSC